MNVFKGKDIMESQGGHSRFRRSADSTEDTASSETTPPSEEPHSEDIPLGDTSLEETTSAESQKGKRER